MKFRKTTAAILAAATTAISTVSALSVSAFAEGTPFTFSVEGAKSADGFEKEAKILTNFIGAENGEFGGILTNDTFITVNNGTEEIASKTYGVFEYYNFSGDGTSLEKKEYYSSYFYRLNFPCWDLDGVDELLPFLPDNEPIPTEEEIDGIGVFNVEYDTLNEDSKMVIDSKISGGLVRKVHEGYNNSLIAMAELVAGENNVSYEAPETKSYDDFDAVNLKICRETEDGAETNYSISFLTESYVNGHSKSTDPSTSGSSTSEPEKKNVDYSDDTTGIKASAEEGVIEEGAQLSAAAVADKTNDKNFTYEISFKKDGKEVQPNGAVTVKIPVPEAIKDKTIYVYRVESDGRYTYLKSKVDGDFVSFETDHFSEYIVTTEKLEDAVKPSDPGKNPNTGIPAGILGIAAVVGAVVIVSKKRR